MPLPQDRLAGFDWILYFGDEEPAAPCDPSDPVYTCELLCRTDGSMNSETNTSETNTSCGTITASSGKTQTIDVSALMSRIPTDCVNVLKAAHETETDVYFLLSTAVAGEVAFYGLASVTSFTLGLGDDNSIADFTLTVQGEWTQCITPGTT